MMTYNRGLVIKSPWIDLILSGAKTWEIRGSDTHIRGRIALIKSGSGFIFGTAELRGSMKVTREELLATFDYHQIPTSSVDKIHYARPHAWFLTDVRPFEEPIPYNHPQGAVIWVDLKKHASEAAKLGVPPHAHQGKLHRIS